MLAASLGTGAGAPRDGSMADLAAPVNAAHTPRAQHDLAGYGSILATMKFMRWAIEQDRFPTVEAFLKSIQTLQSEDKPAGVAS